MTSILKTSTLDGKTLAEVFVKRVALSPQQRVFLIKTDGSYRPWTWGEVHRLSVGLFGSLRRQGIGKGDSVAILSNSRPEWTVADWTILSLGAVTVPVYQSSNAEDTAFILENSGAKLVFAEDAAQGEKLAAAFRILGKTLPVVFFEKGIHHAAYHSTPFEEACQMTSFEDLARDQRAAAEGVAASDLASIVYTSGTTGKAKGARLLHSCFSAIIRDIAKEAEMTTADLTLAFLPYAHVLGRVESMIPLISGSSTAFAESASTLPQNLMEAQPTLLFSVPRIYEKIYAKMASDIEAGAGYRKSLFRWASQVGTEAARLRSKKKPIPLALLLKNQVADRLVFSRIREKMGGRIRFTVSGGAPLARELCEFFHAAGIKIMEGYGLTETTAAICVNRPDDYEFGSVGRPLGGTHFRIAEDGEIQVKGPAVFAGYHGDEAATREAFTADGWFNTGDIGELDARGFIRITDRKKELIVTSGGKNIAPQKLENMIKQIPLVSNVLVYGDKKKYLVALVTLSPGDLKRWTKEHKDGDVRTHLESHLKDMNKKLASYETVKRFEILDKDFTLESGELTPSLKIKRKVICEHYKKEIETLYH